MGSGCHRGFEAGEVWHFCVVGGGPHPIGVEGELMINVSVRTSTDATLRSVLSLPEALTKKQVAAAAAVLWKNVSTPRVQKVDSG